MKRWVCPICGRSAAINELYYSNSAEQYVNVMKGNMMINTSSAGSQPASLFASPLSPHEPSQPESARTTQSDQYTVDVGVDVEDYNFDF